MIKLDELYYCEECFKRIAHKAIDYGELRRENNTEEEEIETLRRKINENDKKRFEQINFC